MKKQHYTFFNPAINDFEEAHYQKYYPGAAARSIFRRILRETDLQQVAVNLTIKNLETGRLYYYKCFAIKNPHKKQLNKFKTITIKYDISILKLNKDFID